MSIKSIALKTVKVVIGFVSLVLLLVSAYEIIEHTNDAPDVSVLAQIDKEASPTPSPMASSEDSKV